MSIMISTIQIPHPYMLCTRFVSCNQIFFCYNKLVILITIKNIKVQIINYYKNNIVYNHVKKQHKNMFLTTKNKFYKR